MTAQERGEGMAQTGSKRIIYTPATGESDIVGFQPIFSQLTRVRETEYR